MILTISKSCKNAVTVLCAVLWLSSASGVSAADAVWESVNQVKVDFQNRFFDLAATRWPAWEDLLKTHHNLQLAMIERRVLIYQYWSVHAPDRIVRNRGIGTFMNLQWSAHDTENFKEGIPGFSELESRIAVLKELNNADPRWQEVKKKFKELEKDPEYGTLLRQTALTLRAGENLLKREAVREKRNVRPVQGGI